MDDCVSAKHLGARGVPEYLKSLTYPRRARQVFALKRIIPQVCLSDVGVGRGLRGCRPVGAGDARRWVAVHSRRRQDASGQSLSGEERPLGVPVRARAIGVPDLF
jgi:hypothetical protein